MYWLPGMLIAQWPSIDPDCALQELKFKEREAKMKVKNTELEESLVRFSKYLQENDAKRARALKKAADEKKLCEERSREAEDLASLQTYSFLLLSQSESLVYCAADLAPS